MRSFMPLIGPITRSGWRTRRIQKFLQIQAIFCVPSVRSGLKRIWYDARLCLGNVPGVHFVPEVEGRKLTQIFRFNCVLGFQNADYDPNFTPSSKEKETSNGNAAKSESGSSDDEGADKPAKKVVRPKMSLGRVLVLVNSVFATLNIVLGLVNLVQPVLLGLTHLVLAYVHSMISYTVILFLALGRPQFNMDWLKSCLQNDNMHYILYCLMFFTTSDPRPGTKSNLLFCVIFSFMALY